MLYTDFYCEQKEVLEMSDSDNVIKRNLELLLKGKTPPTKLNPGSGIPDGTTISTYGLKTLDESAHKIKNDDK